MDYDHPAADVDGSVDVGLSLSLDTMDLVDSTSSRNHLEILKGSISLFMRGR